MDSHRYGYARECLEHLDLRPGATLEDVKRAYRTLVQVWHPDRFAKGTAIQFKAEERFKDVTAAYAWLKDNPTSIEDLAMGRWGDEDRGATDTGKAEADSTAKGKQEPAPTRRWFRRRYRSPIYAGRRWLPQVRVPWVFLGALAVGGYIVLRERDPYGDMVLRPQVFQNVADAIEDPTPENLWVYDQRIDIRRSPGANSPTAGFFERGQRILGAETVEGWRKIVDRESGASLGWVQASQIGPRRPSRAATGVGAGTGEAGVAQLEGVPSPPLKSMPPLESSRDISPVESLAAAPEPARPAPGPAPTAAEGEEGPQAWRPIEYWTETVSLVTEPFDVPRGNSRLVFKTHEVGTVEIQLYLVETNQVTFATTRQVAGTSTLSFRRAGTYRLSVTTPGVPWEASVEAPG